MSDRNESIAVGSVIAGSPKELLKSLRSLAGGDEIVIGLYRAIQAEMENVHLNGTISVSRWDGAFAFHTAVQKRFGSDAHEISSAKMSVEVELGKTIQIPWGMFFIPALNAKFLMDTREENGREVFTYVLVCERRREKECQEFLDEMRKVALSNSIHRGKAFTISFHDEYDSRQVAPVPKFFDMAGDEPFFSATLMDKIERNVFVPIRYAKGVEEMQERNKRGILFAGKFGVGKTLLAGKIAREATAHGWIFIYVKDATELPEALQFAEHYQPVVVFAEDVDRVAGEERTDEVNDLLNQLDGIDSKSAQIMTILSSNRPELINEAMRRPGRIGVVLEVLPPDAETVERMIRHYAGKTLSAKSDLSEVSNILAGETPARIRETIGRAKLEALRRSKGNSKEKINASDLAAAARDVKEEALLFQRNANSKPSENVTALAAGFEVAAAAMKRSLNGVTHPAHA
jgi:hypothetical protein